MTDYFYKDGKEPDGPSVNQGYVFGGYALQAGPITQSVPIVVVTPTCDFYQSKGYVRRAVVLPVLPFSLLSRVWAAVANITWDDTQAKVLLDSKSKRDRFLDFVRKLLNGNIASIHYLPPCSVFGHSFVFFDWPLSVPLDNFDDLSFVTALQPPFREHLSTRFSAYYLRVGTADLPDDHIAAIQTEYSYTSGMTSGE